MEINQARQFRILSDEEFKALTTSEKVAYLQNAISARNAINRQIDAVIIQDIAKKDA